MTDLTTFKNETFGEVRTVMRDGEPWFVAADVCEFFGVTNRNRVLQNLDDDEKGGTQIDTPGGTQTMTIINEAGLYSLLFYLQPTKARGISEEQIAERCELLRKYKRWITHEVVPAIRKHGAYATDEFIERSVQGPDYALAILTALKEERNKTKALEAENAKKTVELAIAQPKVEYFNELVDRNLLTNFRITAKELGIKEKPFIKFLIEHRYIYRDQCGKLLPKADKNDGLFEVKECYNERTDWRGTQTLITPKGRETFRLLCQGV